MASIYNGTASHERWENLTRAYDGDEEINVGRTERIASGIAAAVVVSGSLNFLTAGVSTSPGWSSNVIGELSHGLLKSATSPAATNERASALATAARKPTLH